MRIENYPSITSAKSEPNGIKFDSEKNKEYFIFSTRDFNGNIKTYWLNSDEYNRRYKTKEQIHTDKIFEILSTILAVLFFSVFSIMAYKFDVNKLLVYSYRLILLECFIMIVISILVMVLAKNETFLKYHSAEHMVLNAYNNLNRVPTLEECKNYSRYSNSCGGNLLIKVGIDCILLILFSYLSLKVAIILSLFTIFVTLIISQIGAFNFIQKITTAEPTDDELEVAICGMEAWYQKETECDAEI